MTKDMPRAIPDTYFWYRYIVTVNPAIYTNGDNFDYAFVEISDGLLSGLWRPVIPRRSPNVGSASQTVASVHQHCVNVY